MRIRNHYVEFLSEVGSPIRRKGEKIYSLQNELKLLEKKVKDLKNEITDQEDDLFNEVRKLWSIEEITEAKIRYKKQ